MEKNDKLKRLLSILALIAILVWVRAFKSPAPKRGTRRNIGSVGIVSSEGESAFFLSAQKQKRPKSAYTGWKRNPFTIETPDRDTIFKLVLEGIIWDEKNPAAMINGQIVNIGDRVGGSMVMGISENSVTLNDGISSFELRL